MMKFVLLIFLVGFASGCGEDADVVLQVPVSLSFDFPSQISIKETDGKELIIPVQLSETQTFPVSVRLDIIGVEVVNGSDFNILSSNPLLIQPGATQATLNLRLNDNTVLQPEERKIFIKIRSVEPSSVEVKAPKQVVVTIEEDDCPANVPKVEVWIGEVDIEGPFDPVAGLALENPNGLCSGMVNVRGRFFGTQNPESTLTIALAQNFPGATSGTTTVENGSLFTFTDQFLYEAIGTYNEESGEIVLNFSLFDQVNSLNNFTGTHVVRAK